MEAAGSSVMEVPKAPRPVTRSLAASSGRPPRTSPPPTASRPAGPELEIHSPKVSLLNSPSHPTVPAFPSGPGAGAATPAPLTPPKSPAKQKMPARRMSLDIAKESPVSLMKKLTSHEMQSFVRRQRQLLYEMAKAGVIVVHPDVIIRVGIDGSLEVDGTRDDQGAVKVGSRVFSKDNIPDSNPPVYLAGRNIHPSLVSPNGRRLTHRDFLKMRGDSVFYAWAVKTLASLPDMTHERWWDALESLQKLRKGERSQKVLVGPLYKAHIFDKMDRATIHNIGVKLNMNEDFTNEEVDVKLPMAIGRLMGLSPPAVLSVGEVWEDQFCAYAFEIDGQVADAATSLLSTLKLMAKHPDADNHLRPVAMDKQEFLENAFQKIQDLPEMKSLHKFVESAVKAGWH